MKNKLEKYGQQQLLRFENELTKEEKEQCLTKLFNAFDSSNIEETNQLYSISKTKNFIKQLYYIDSESKENLIDVFKEMIW